LFQPETYSIALAFMIVSMLCWGSWANTIKFCPKYPFQLFYWDYVIGLAAGAMFWGMTLGSLGSHGRPFLLDLSQSSRFCILMASIGGALFNVANLLLVIAIDICGMAVAFPVAIGLALVVGAVSSYVISPKGNPTMLFGGIALVVVAIVLNAVAYRLRETRRRTLSARGVVICVLSGLLMGSFYPFVSKAMLGDKAPGPYAITLFFVLGVALCSIPMNYALMRWPLAGREPVLMRGYWKASAPWHFWGLAGGVMWCTGAVLNFVASRSHIVGPAISYSIGQGATMISACWGVFVWREFGDAPSEAKTYLTRMFFCFVCGLTLIALAPTF